MHHWLIPDDADPVGPEVTAWRAEQAGPTAAIAAERWGLTPDGRGWAGWWGIVWPVRDAAGRPLALKVAHERMRVGPEGSALQAWDATGASVRCVAVDREANALLLERLDGSRLLEAEPDADAASEIAFGLVAAMDAANADGAALGLPRRADAAATLRDTVARRAAEHPELVPADAVARAIETFDWLAADPTDRLLHLDVHFSNVAATLDGTSWRAIDPLPETGRLEWEALPVLRNKFDHAVATGDADRALRRRVDRFCALTGGDPDVTRALAQAVAVDMLGWLLLEYPDHRFIAPQTLLAGWR